MDFTNDFLTDIRDHLQEHLESQHFQKKVQDVAKSRLWAKIADVLCVRREQLYSQTPKTSFEMAQRDGALAEVQRLLRYGPSLVCRPESSDKTTQPASEEAPIQSMVSPSLNPDEDGLG